MNERIVFLLKGINLEFYKQKQYINIDLKRQGLLLSGFFREFEFTYYYIISLFHYRLVLMVKIKNKNFILHICHKISSPLTIFMLFD